MTRTRPLRPLSLSVSFYARKKCSCTGFRLETEMAIGKSRTKQSVMAPSTYEVIVVLVVLFQSRELE